MEGSFHNLASSWRGAQNNNMRGFFKLYYAVRTQRQRMMSGISDKFSWIRGFPRRTCMPLSIKYLYLILGYLVLMIFKFRLIYRIEFASVRFSLLGIWNHSITKRIFFRIYIRILFKIYSKKKLFILYVNVYGSKYGHLRRK